MEKEEIKSGFPIICFFWITLCFFAVILAFSVYFLIPDDSKKSASAPVDLETVSEEQNEGFEQVAEIPGDVDFQNGFDSEEDSDVDDFLSEVSFAAFNKSSDKGLILYRQSMSKAAVVRFYTSVTGDKEISKAILSEADRNSIPLSLAFALAYTESRYKVTAVNHNTNSTVDRGLFQLNSSSFPALSESDFFDPYISAKYGMSHLKHCLNMAGNEVSALAMYNAGSGSVRSNRTPQTTLNYIGKIITYQKMLDDMFYQEVVSFYETQIVPGITPAFNNDGYFDKDMDE